MDRALSIGLVAFAVVAASAVVFVATEGHVVKDGCAIVLASEASEDVAYDVEFKGRSRSGTLAANATETLSLCTLSPRSFPLAVVAFEGREVASETLDPRCSPPRFVVNDSAARVDTRLCA